MPPRSPNALRSLALCLGKVKPGSTTAMGSCVDLHNKPLKKKEGHLWPSKERGEGPTQGWPLVAERGSVTNTPKASFPGESSGFPLHFPPKRDHTTEEAKTPLTRKRWRLKTAFPLGKTKPKKRDSTRELDRARTPVLPATFSTASVLGQPRRTWHMPPHTR